MKRLLHIFIVLLITLCCKAEDILVLHSGDIIRAIVLEISQHEIKFKRTSNPDGPTYTQAKANILSIQYENGEVDKFESENKQTGNIRQIANNKNTELIKSINTASIEHDKSIGGITNANLTAIWGIKDGSILSDNNILLSFEKFHIGKYNEKIEGYRFKIQNETSQAVYIDLTNSFFYNSSLGSVPFFRNKTYSQSVSNGANVALNLGTLTSALGVGGTVGTLANGASVGMGSNSGNVISESEKPILIIPPYSFAYLPCEKSIMDGEIKEIPYILYFYNRQIGLWSSDENTYRYMRSLISSKKLKIDSSNLTSKSIGTRKNGLVEFTEMNSPKEYGIILTYVLDGDTSNIFRMPINLYLKGLFGSAIEFSETYKHSEYLIYGPAHILK